VKKILFFVTSIVLAVMGTAAVAQVRSFVPVTPAMLLNPSPDDWLMYSRTYDAQRYSPLNQISICRATTGTRTTRTREFS